MKDTIEHDLSNPDIYTHWADDHVRYGDLDPVGHANNAAYATFFETGRFALLEDIKGMNTHQHDTAVVQLNISFIRELQIGTQLRIGVKIGRLGNSSIQIFSGIFAPASDGSLVCHATSEAISVVFDKLARKSVPIPADIRKKLERYQ